MKTVVKLYTTSLAGYVAGWLAVWLANENKIKVMYNNSIGVSSQIIMVQGGQHLVL